MSMDLNVKDLAKKSLLRLTEEEEIEFKKDLLSVIDMINVLPEIDGDPFYLEKEDAIPLRKDEIKPSIKSEKILYNAKEIEAGCFSVPKIMEE